MDAVKGWLCCLIMGLQVSGVAFARFTDLRYFCWAPNDQHTEYKIELSLYGNRLTGPEIKMRYMIPDEGFDERSFANIWSILRAYEDSYGQEAQVELHMKYRINGKEWKELVWKKSQ